MTETKEYFQYEGVATAPERCSVTPQQERDWTMTRTAFLYTCPAFAHVLYTMMTPYEDSAYFTKEVPIAATDDKNLFLNPDRFFKDYDLHERVFIVAHEVAHAIFGHCGMAHMFTLRGKVGYADGTSLDYDGDLMNRALDYFINAMLVDAKVGKAPKDCLLDQSKFTADMSPIDIYRELHKNGDGNSGQKPFDQHLKPGAGAGQDATAAVQQRSDQSWKTEVAAGLASAKLQGKLPAGLERMLGDIIDPKVSWQDQIKGLFARKIGSGSYNWRRPDKRFMGRAVDPFYVPSRSGHGCECVVVGIDTSGSITDRVLASFFGEMSGIIEDVRPRRIIVIFCDARVARVDEIEDAGDLTALRKKGAPGGGGTAFEPVFAEVDKIGVVPDALVYLTDGYGSFPAAEPTYPVIWGNITGGLAAESYPWGNVVDIPVDGA